MSAIPGNLFLLGIVISILFFVLGIRSFSFKKQWFEGSVYFIISAFAIEILSVWLLNPIIFQNCEYVLLSGSTGMQCLLSIVGALVGILSPVRLLTSRKCSCGNIGKSTIMVFIYTIYLYMMPACVSLIHRAEGGTDINIDGINYFFVFVVILHFLSMAVHPIRDLYTSKNENEKKVVAVEKNKDLD